MLWIKLWVHKLVVAVCVALRTEHLLCTDAQDLVWRVQPFFGFLWFESRGTEALILPETMFTPMVSKTQWKIAGVTYLWSFYLFFFFPLSVAYPTETCLVILGSLSRGPERSRTSQPQVSFFFNSCNNLTKRKRERPMIDQ